MSAVFAAVHESAVGRSGRPGMSALAPLVGVERTSVSVWSPPAAVRRPDRGGVHPRRSSAFRPDRAQPGAPCARAHFALAARSPVTSLHALFTRTVPTLGRKAISPLRSRIRSCWMIPGENTLRPGLRGGASAKMPTSTAIALRIAASASGGSGRSDAGVGAVMSA